MTDLIICGVGGQGIISIGHILSKSCISSDLNFISSETHGMSQRGGSVIFHFRIGNKKSPLIPKGQAQVILSGEPIESLRCLEYLEPYGIVLTNEHPTPSPISAILGIEYPNLDEVYEKIIEWPARLFKLDAFEIASSIGLPQSQNIALLGGLIALDIIPIDGEYVKEIIKTAWMKYSKQNLKAFELGYQSVKNALKSDEYELALPG